MYKSLDFLHHEIQSYIKQILYKQFFIFIYGTICISDKLECSDDTMNWNSAQDYCMSRGSEMMMAVSFDCNHKHDRVTGQWLGLRREGRINSVSNKQGFILY